MARITEKMENTLLWIGIFRDVIRWVGVGVIALVSFWDIIVSGARGFMEYSVGWGGIVAIWVGLVLILMDSIADFYFEERQ